MTLELVIDTVKQIRQRDQINMTNEVNETKVQPREDENLRESKMQSLMQKQKN